MKTSSFLLFKQISNHFPGNLKFRIKQINFLFHNYVITKTVINMPPHWKCCTCSLWFDACT